eukprot:13717833-Heterocapsa_arctica.AAC.1
MTIHSHSVGSYGFWIDCLTSFIADNRALMSEDLDGVMRFPARVPCIIFDNLNILYNAKSGDFEGMTKENWAQARAMFVLMDQFRCRFYLCSAPAARWGLGSGCDVASARARRFATGMNIPCWSGASFWDDLE